MRPAKGSIMRPSGFVAYSFLNSDNEEEDGLEVSTVTGDNDLKFPRKNMLGYVFRSQLLNMLDKGIGVLQEGQSYYNLSDSHEEILGLVEDLKEMPLKRDAGGQDEVIRSLSQEESGFRLDLRPFMQLDPCIISSTANVAKVGQCRRCAPYLSSSPPIHTLPSSLPHSLCPPLSLILLDHAGVQALSKDGTEPLVRCTSWTASCDRGGDQEGSDL